MVSTEPLLETRPATRDTSGCATVYSVLYEEKCMLQEELRLSKLELSAAREELLESYAEADILKRNEAEARVLATQARKEAEEAVALHSGAAQAVETLRTELSRVNRSLSDSEKAHKAARAAEIEQLKEEHANFALVTIAAMVLTERRTRAEELAELKASHERAVAELTRSFASDIAALTARLKAARKRQIAKLMKRHAASLAAAEAAKDAAVQAVRELSEELDEARRELDAAAATATANKRGTKSISEKADAVERHTERIATLDSESAASASTTRTVECDVAEAVCERAARRAADKAALVAAATAALAKEHARRAASRYADGSSPAAP